MELLSKKTLKDLNFKNRVALVRVDYNVPILDGVITDSTRISASFKTLRYLIDCGAKIVLFSHLGRVKNAEDLKSKTLLPVFHELKKLLKNVSVSFIDETRGSKLENSISTMKSGEIILVENTRFEDFPNKKESKNDPELGKYWASLGDVFVNEAFATSHRSHASNVGIANNIDDSCVGYLIEKEIKALGHVLTEPEHPYVAILGGAKVSDKILIIENLLKKADKLIIGGGMAYTFLKAQGYSIGTSLLEEDKISLAKKYLKENSNKIFLPVDFAITKEFTNSKPIYTEDQNIPDGMMGLDCGPKSSQKFKEILSGAKTIVWNGPLGVFEFSNYATGTIKICETIAKMDDCYSLIGGGDSASAALNLGFADKFNHISTGGGASLEFLEGKELPGISAIKSK